MNILYEDNHLLCAVKPQNMPVAEDESRDLDLLNALKGYIKEKYQKPGAVFLGLVHRLDRPAGGVLVFARTSKAAARLFDAMRSGKFEKTYLAVLCGSGPDQGELVDYLVKDEKTRCSRVISKGEPGAKEARLSFETIARAEGLTLVKIRLHTGRHHQIRVQFASRGLPLYGDARYNPQSKPGQQLALWAASLSFPHPTRKETITIAQNPPSLYPWTEFAKHTIGFSIPILYEDGKLLAVDKPVGMEVEGELSALVRRRFPTARPCHRLDANTTGITLFALTEQAYEDITNGIKQRKIEKIYRCVVKGRPHPSQKLCRAWLKKDAEAARVFICDRPIEGAKEILTEYWVEESRGDTSVLSVKLITGRTHQIRAHLAHLGHPILGDDKYGDRAFNKGKGQKTQLLRAVRVVVDIPGYQTTIEAPCTF
ncbi:MAG: RluA family pseudouridine synthase [Christensenellales bacterium]